MSLSPLRVLSALTVLAVCVTQALAAERGTNLLADPGFESEGAWQPMGDGFTLDRDVKRGGGASLRCDSSSTEGSSGALQVIRFETPVQHPMYVRGWSRARAAAVEQDYDIYLDVHYDDGTPLWGQIASFEPGTHDWAFSEYRFTPAKPVREIEVFVFLRKASGTVWFDDLEVGLTPFTLEDVRVAPGLFGAGSFGLTARSSLPMRWEATVEQDGHEVARTEGDGPVRVLHAGGDASDCSVRVTATDTLRGETISRVFSTPTAGEVGPPRPYALWTESSMNRVLPGALPPEDAPASASVSLAGSEYESFQVLLLAPPGHPLRDVRVGCEDLVRTDGEARIARSGIEWQQVGYVRLTAVYEHPLVPEAAPGWWPDALLPVETVDVEPGFAQSLWFTVHAPAGTPAGEYRGRVRVAPSGAAATEVPLTVRVYPFDLPVEGHMKTAFALMDGYLEQDYGKPLDPAIRREFGDFVLRHRLNPDDISRTEPPPIEDLAAYDRAGMNAFNVLNMVEERGDAAWVCWSPLEAYTPAFRQRLIERLDPYVARLREAGLARKAYIYTFDERGEDFFPTITEYFGLVKERYPEVHTLTTAIVPLEPEVMERLNVDWNCPVTPRYDLAAADRCRAAGREVWSYICLGPRYPYANWLAEHPLVESRVLWWQTYQQRMDGFLYWGLNIWSRAHNDRPIDPTAGPLLQWSISTGGEYEWLNGDGVLLYPGKDGPIGSIRLANIRDGLEDYEYLWLLAQGSGGEDRARRACLPVTRGLTEFTRDPSVVLATRERIAARIGGR